MSLSEPDHELVVAELGREPTAAEAALFENLWSEHCAYRSSRPCCRRSRARATKSSSVPATTRRSSRCPSRAPPTFRPPTATPTTTAISTSRSASRATTTLLRGPGRRGSHRGRRYRPRHHVDGRVPHRPARLAVLRRLRPRALAVPLRGRRRGHLPLRQLYRRPHRRRQRRLPRRVRGEPLVNVACVGLTNEERLVTATAQEPGNKLVLVGNGTGRRDGLGGASFASEDLAEDAETEDRPRGAGGRPLRRKAADRVQRGAGRREPRPPLATSARRASVAPPPSWSRRAGSALGSTSTASTSANRT